MNTDMSSATTHRITQVEDIDGNRLYFRNIDEAIGSRSAAMAKGGLFTETEVCSLSAEWGYLAGGESETVSPTTHKSADRCDFEPGSTPPVCRSHSE